MPRSTVFKISLRERSDAGQQALEAIIAEFQSLHGVRCVDRRVTGPFVDLDVQVEFETPAEGRTLHDTLMRAVKSRRDVTLASMSYDASLLVGE
jgi:hypothetical protein